MKKEPNRSTLPLSEFIQAHHKKIIEEWVTFARTLKPWAKGLSKKALQDHAEELLDAIVSDMKASQSGHEQSQKSKGRDKGGALAGVGKKHAIDRLEGGLKLDQLVSEYRALRASVIRLPSAVPYRVGWKEGFHLSSSRIIRFSMVTAL